MKPQEQSEEEKFSELFSIAYDRANRKPALSEEDMSDFLVALSSSLALTLKERIGMTVDAFDLSEQLLIIHISDEKGEIAKDKKGFGITLFHRLKLCNILHSDPEKNPESADQPQFTLDLFKTVHERVNIPGSMTFIQDISKNLVRFSSFSESEIKEAIMDVLLDLTKENDSQKAQEIIRKEPERFYSLLMGKLNKGQE